mgnify:CR=1 FL=1
MILARTGFGSINIGIAHPFAIALVTAGWRVEFGFLAFVKSLSARIFKISQVLIAFVDFYFEIISLVVNGIDGRATSSSIRDKSSRIAVKTRESAGADGGSIQQ